MTYYSEKNQNIYFLGFGKIMILNINLDPFYIIDHKLDHLHKRHIIL